MSNLLEIEVRGHQELSLKIDSLANIDLQGILDESAAILFNAIRTRFMQGVDTEGGAWAPLKTSTIAAKAKRYGGGGTLFASGKLFHSLQIYSVGADSRAIGTDVPYAKFHQYGTVRMPKREFIGISDESRQLVQSFVLRKVQEALGNG